MRGYDAAWDRASREFLRANPFCQYCEAGAFGEVRTSAAELTDHLYPHKGDRALFWTREWWVACCAPCHNGPKQAEERQGPRALARLATLLSRPARGGGG